MAKKATNRKVNKDFLSHRQKIAAANGYPKQRWVHFCETMLEHGFELTLYEARRTVSKYVTVWHPFATGKSFKVRFSNHKPILDKELAGDCDFFVGRTNLVTTRTEDAIAATFRHFKGDKP